VLYSSQCEILGCGLVAELGLASEGQLEPHWYIIVSMKNKLLFLLLASFSTVFSVLIFASFQYILRQSANDPQIQIANDVAQSISIGKDPRAIDLGTKTDMVVSQSPFVIIYDSKRNIISSSANVFGNKLSNTKPPQGVFDFVKNRFEYRFTWEPTTSWRYAAVIVPSYYKGEGGEQNLYFVLVARSLAETEKRTFDLMKLVAFAWLASLISSAILIKLINKKKS